LSRWARPFRSQENHDERHPDDPARQAQAFEANVRKNDSNLFIEEFADSIEAKGLLQNLIVVPAKKHGPVRCHCRR
jgi:ParB-like chromosome segregation protein Spo0J